jgi:heptaprenyl diphosphate synthase
MKTKKIALLGISLSLAMILSFVESLIPPLVAVPGIKIGLANLVIVFLLFKTGVKYAAAVSLVRVILSSMLFGNLQVFVFSFAGAILSLAGMAIMKKTNLFSIITVSVCGGILHNIGQIIVAAVWTSTPEIMYYLPVLLVSGTAAGILIGIVSGIVVKKLDNMKLD